jgi:plastocyanin
MTKLLALSCSVLALLFVAAGCGSSNDDGGGGGGEKKQSQQPAKEKPKNPPNVTQVAEKNIQFSPKTVTVKKGTTVKWVNEDSVNHDVTKTSGPGPNFASGQGDMKPGNTYIQPVDTPGTIKYQCTVHPGMTGTITVK